MNRAEKRRIKRSDKNESMLLTYLDMSDPCIVAAMDDHGLNINEISQILKKNSEYLQDYTKYVEVEGGFGMVKNEELMVRVKAKIQRCMEGKMNKAKALKILKNEFNLPLAVLSDLWIECKVDNTKMKGEANMRKALTHDECLVTNVEEYDEVRISAADSINNVIPEKEIISEVTCGLDTDGDRLKSGEIKNKPTNWTPYTNEDKPSLINSKNQVSVKPIGLACVKESLVGRDKPVETKYQFNHFTVISKTVQIRGQYGTYTKSDEGVSIDSKLYKDKAAITSNKKILAESYKEEITDIQKEIDKLITKLREVENTGIREIEQLTELETVFDMSF